MKKELGAALTFAGDGSRNNDTEQGNSSTPNTETQCQIVLAYLLTHGSITTLQARNELYIMAIAARIFELKERGHNIITHREPVYFGGKRKIARYVLLAGKQS